MSSGEQTASTQDFSESSLLCTLALWENEQNLPNVFGHGWHCRGQRAVASVEVSV